MHFAKVIASLILVSIMFSGCTTMKLVEGASSNQEILKNINPGERIHVELNDGSKHEIRVRSVTPESVKGEKIEIPIDQIKSIKKEQVSALKTTGAVIGGYFVYIGIAALILISTL